ncbi:hypothetical protein Pan216_31600 [Planctomycetes bacterium Pan216]|uniref:MetA-pathway of phenol degradation n=1 Tax=Kolteria novifilia TaxID=2527975 RepID=A0A518B5N9_9BACT|nr:hypothetical protein Pan216_31600 [Planctomycetes bacterium Pan216]
MPAYRRSLFALTLLSALTSSLKAESPRITSISDVAFSSSGESLGASPCLEETAAGCCSTCKPLGRGLFAPEPHGARTLFRWNVEGDEETEPFCPFNEPLVGDRPDFTEASSTVGKGVLQIESGYTYVYDSEAGVVSQSHVYPEILVRLGMIANWFEFRFGYTYTNITEDEPGAFTSLNGSEDIYLGAKLMLTEQRGLLPEMTILPQMTIPTGSPSLTNKQVLPGVNWLYSWAVNDLVAVAGSTQINRSFQDAFTFFDPGSGGLGPINVDPEYHTEFAQSATAGFSLIEDKLGAFTEWFALVPVAANGGERTQHYFDGGFTYLVNNNLQFDIRVGVGLNEASDDFFTGTGAIARF